MELQPESDAQPAIKPTQFILHSIVAPWTPQRTYEYWRDGTNLESHFGLGYDGSLGQYIGTETRADATGAANRRADGTGAVSLESASNLQASDPWTAEQVESLIRLGVWLHEKHGIPLRICRAADDPGYGYHRLFTAWNPDGHSCPGDARVTQFKTVVFPGIVARATGQTTDPQEDPMAGITKQDIYDAVWKTDQIAAPADAADVNTNPTWQPQSYLKVIDQRLQKIQAAGSVGLTDAQVSQIADKVAASTTLADQIAEKVAAKLAQRLSA
jgi:hypothetical protein